MNIISLSDIILDNLNVIVKLHRTNIGAIGQDLTSLKT